MSKNQKVTPREIAKIRKLADFDLIMLISEIHDHGWPMARATLCLMPPDPDEAGFRTAQAKPDYPKAPDVRTWTKGRPRRP